MAGADPLALLVRFGLYVALGVAFGLPLFTLYAPDAGAAGLRRALISTSIVGVALSIVGLILLAASMSGIPAASVDRAAVEAILSLPAIGTAVIIRIGALVLLAVAAFAIRRPRPLAVAGVALGGTALASLTWTGHGNMSEGLWALIHLAADVVHLLAAGAWLGALVALVILLTRPVRSVSADHVARTHAALAGFSVIGSVIVGLIVATGLVNLWTVIGVGNVGALFTTVYGWLFIAKLALFGAMLGLAAANRFHLTPALERAGGEPSHQLKALRTSLGVETLAAVSILALVAWLGLLAPPGLTG